jgi:hypothetical protein
MRQVEDALFGGAAFAQIAKRIDAADCAVRMSIADDHLDRDEPAVGEELRLEAL